MEKQALGMRQVKGRQIAQLEDAMRRFSEDASSIAALQILMPKHREPLMAHVTGVN